MLKKNIPDSFSMLLFAAVWLLTLGGGIVAAGWSWDFANGLGFAAVAGLVYLCVQGAGRVAVLQHQAFSYVVVLLVVVHAAWFLIADSVVVEYLKPGAPAYMWAGLLSLFSILFLVISARPTARKKSFLNRLSFRGWHRALSWLAIGAALFHILGSSLYVRDALQYLLLMLIILPALAPTPWSRYFDLRGYPSSSLLMLAVCLAAAISLSRNVWQL
ncbi:MAG: hypothetical protein ACR2P1_26390 [Pseudomonadales bacterium]